MLRSLFIIYLTGHRLWRWARRRFTPMGLAALLALGITALFGLDTNQTMAYQLFTLLASLWLVALIGICLVRPRFTGERKLPKYATVGQPFSFQLKINNPAGKWRRGWHIIEEAPKPDLRFDAFRDVRGGEGTSGKNVSLFWVYRRFRRFVANHDPFQFQEIPLPDLPPKSFGQTRIELTPLIRGPLHLGGIKVANTDPLGFMRRISRSPAEQTVMVLPKRYSLPPIELPGSRRHQPGGVALAGSVGESEEFVAMRDYRSGDPLRRIHWKSWAKVGKPIVKEYQEEFFVRHALILDTFQNAPTSDRFEEAVSLAASFASTVSTQESLLDLMFVGPEAYVFTVGRGVAHTDRMLEILASVQPCRDKTFDSLWPLILRRAGLLSGCICILLDWDEARQSLIGKMHALGLPMKVLVVMEEHGGPALDPGPMAAELGAFHHLVPGRIEQGVTGL
jgi:uncharacterized protein (DUF58 family)